MSGGVAVKRACRIRIVQCKLVSIKWEGGDFHVTADHSLLVRTDGNWCQVDADCVLEGDEIMVLDTHLGIAGQEVLVTDVDYKDLDVVEVELENPTTTMFVASSCQTGPYAGVLGKQPENSYLRILVMEVSQRPIQLAQAFRKSISLQMCNSDDLCWIFPYFFSYDLFISEQSTLSGDSFESELSKVKAFAKGR